MIKNLPAMQKTQVPGLGQYPGEGIYSSESAFSSILAWRFPRTEIPYSTWGHKESDTVEQLTLSLFTCLHSYLQVKMQILNSIHNYAFID